MDLPGGLELRPWRDEDLAPAGKLDFRGVSGPSDSEINDQYRSVHGSQRFLHNIVRYAGCGVFSAAVSARSGGAAQQGAGGAGARFAGESAERGTSRRFACIQSTDVRVSPGCCFR